jgi:hypothetical protein
MSSSVFMLFTFTLWAVQVAALWPFDYWNFGAMENPWPVLSVEVNNTRISLDNLNNDVLRIFCDLTYGIKTRPAGNPQFPDGPDIPRLYPAGARAHSTSAIQRLSTASKPFGNLTEPRIFESIKIDGNWRQAFEGLRILENCPAALEQARQVFYASYQSRTKCNQPQDLSIQCL